MKKLLILFLLSLGLSNYSLAVGAVFKSSNTATADTTKSLCRQAGASHRGVLHGACVNTGTAGTLTIYNAFNSAVSPVGAIDTAAKGCANYDVLMSSGITYTNSATANVTIMYDCY